MYTHNDAGLRVSLKQVMANNHLVNNKAMCSHMCVVLTHSFNILWMYSYT